MNLVDGKIMETEACEAVLDCLDARIAATLEKPRLTAECVIQACDRLVSAMSEETYLPIIQELGIPEGLGRGYIAQAKELFSAEALSYRMEKELGVNYDQGFVCKPSAGVYTVREEILPLGVLLHVAAGNADGLPAFSVLEGLLTGNINIVKLPAAEGGISVRILLELIRIEPCLSEYIYVFDYSSKDIVHIKKLTDVADGVVVWGGVEAVAGIRALLSPNVKLIEWGHKISFAYVTKEGITQEGLVGILSNIVSTGQLLCSSCQGIFIDTEDMDEAYSFCEAFLPMLERAVMEQAASMNISLRAQAALQRYSTQLESAFNGTRMFSGQDCSVIASDDSVPTPAVGFANVWVKALARNQIVPVLRPYKNYLQTVALLCSEAEKPEIVEKLQKTGAVRICSGGRMSATYLGAAHDGEYPLRRYTKVFAVEEE